ncbi:MAG TPA: amidohydrolase family protein [Acidimicrobiales bacterium]|nr:amidohydrolase family protein [Acidimicrobiales bacterium]
MSLEVSGAELVWTGRREVAGGTVWCDGGRVVEEKPPGAERLDASGCIVTPGLINAHHHLLQSAFRTLPGAHHVPMAQWLAIMAAAYRAAGVDADMCRAAASVGIAEGLLCGVTTVADHHLTWPAGGDHRAMALATISAAAELGARLVFVRGSAGDDPEATAASADELAATLPLGAGGVSADGMLQLAVGPAGVHSDRKETFDLLAEVAGRRGLRRRTQANEQVDVERAAAQYGRRPLELLDEWGWLAADVTIAHLCGTTEAELDRLAARGVTVTHAPGCDVASGWGVAPVAALLRRRVPVGLGTSGGGSNDAGHLLADARLALQVAPLAPFAATAQALTARAVLTMATAGSAAGLGRAADLGHLEVGGAADLCCWDVGGVVDAGVHDALAGLLWASPGRRPRHVVVAGRVVVRDGQLVTADERSLAAQLAARIRRG